MKRISASFALPPPKYRIDDRPFASVIYEKYINKPLEV